MSKNNRNPEQLHIAMIGHKRVPSREGGIEIVVWELATRLRDLGYKVDCYNRHGASVHPKRDYEHGTGYGPVLARGNSDGPAPAPGESDSKTGITRAPGLYKDGIRILTIPTFKNGKLNAIVYAALASVRALFGGYDVIHYHAEGPSLMLWLPKLFGIRVIATIHGLDWQRAKWGAFASKMLLAGEKMAAKHADEVIVLSKNVQEYFRETYGRETHFIPNGISRPELRKPDEITKRYGLKGDDYILTLCRIVPEKGLHYLLEAYKDIQSDKKIVIAGGFSNAAEYMEEIKRMAAEDDRVVMTDFVHDEVLEELCSNAYVYCLPSDVEGMSLSLLEAMSYGRCCLVSDIQENTEVVEDKAVTFHKGDVADLRARLQDLLDHPDKVQQYKDAAADFICTKYNWDRTTAETIKLYRAQH